MRFLSIAICWAVAAVSQVTGALDAPHSSLSALASRSDDGSYIYRYSYADAPRDVIGPDDVIEPAYPPANATDLAAPSNTAYEDDDEWLFAYNNSTLGADDWMLSDDNDTYSYAYDTYYNDRNNLTGTYYTPYYYNGYEDNVNSESTTTAAASAAAAADDFADDIPHGGLMLYDVDDDTALAALNALDDATLERTWVSTTLAAWSALYTAAFFGNATAAPSTPSADTAESPEQKEDDAFPAAIDGTDDKTISVALRFVGNASSAAPTPTETDTTSATTAAANTTVPAGGVTDALDAFDAPTVVTASAFYTWFFGNNGSSATPSRVTLLWAVFFGNESAPYAPPMIPVGPNDDDGYDHDRGAFNLRGSHNSLAFA